MSRRIRPNKAERAKLKALTGRTNLYESAQLASIRTDGTRYDATTETERENWFVTAKSTHRTKYGWHYTRRMLNRAKDQHPTGCHIETPTTPTESRHEGTQLPELPRRDLPTATTFNTDGNSEPRYKVRSHQIDAKPTRTKRVLNVCDHCRIINTRTEPRKRLYRIVCDHRPITK